MIRRCLDPEPERRYDDVLDALRRLRDTVDRRPIIRLTHKRKRALAVVLLFTGAFAVAAWRYTRSVYSASGEALRLYRQGNHSYQLGLPWKATQLYERALEQDTVFTGARAYLAEAWMDLDQPQRARAELERTSAITSALAASVAVRIAARTGRAGATPRGSSRLRSAYANAPPALRPQAKRPMHSLPRQRPDTGPETFAGALQRYQVRRSETRIVRCTAILAHTVASMAHKRSSGANPLSMLPRTASKPRAIWMELPRAGTKMASRVWIPAWGREVYLNGRRRPHKSVAILNNRSPYPQRWPNSCKTLATRRPPMSRSARQFRLRTGMI